MAWKKSPPEFVAWYTQRVQPYPSTIRAMFGFRVFFCGDNMFTGLFEDGVILRLSATDREAILGQQDEVTPFTPNGRTMKEYVFIPGHLLESQDFCDTWISKSYAYTTQLPPKATKSKAPQQKGQH